MPKSSKTLVVDLTSDEKDCCPFWNERCKEIASSLSLPIVTGSDDSDSILSNGLLNDLGEKLWFSIEQNILQSKSLPETYYQFYMSFRVDYTDCEVINQKLLRINPSAEQRKIFKHWTDISRWVYNWTLAYLRDKYIKAHCKETITWMDIKKEYISSFPSWTQDVPYQIKAIAIKDACNSFWRMMQSRKKKRKKIKFKSKKESKQSCYIPKSAVKDNGIYIRISGKRKKFYREPLPNNYKDCRLIWWNGKWYLSVPYSRKLYPRCENQARDIVALDPGVRTFIAYYSPFKFGRIGIGAYKIIYEYCLRLDKLISKYSKSKSKKKRLSYRRAIFKIRDRIRNLITELHYKSARFLCKNFSTIILPKYETKKMSSKSNRKIRSKTVRSMLSLAFYRFRQILENIAYRFNTSIVYCNESYTSKTHPETGEVNDKLGGSKFIKLLNGSKADRDLIGARNLMIKALMLGPTPHYG